MKILYWIFGLNKVYDSKYGAAFIIDATLLLILVFAFDTIITVSHYADFRFLSFLLYAGIGIYLLREVVQAIYVWHRMKGRTYKKSPSNSFISSFYSSAVVHASEGGGRQDTATHVIDEGDHWKLYDAVFSFYRKTKNGEYKSRKMYYTVMEMRLQRMMPHLMFDSKTAKGNQFRYNYLQSQRISFEGNFNDYFESYSPQKYQIDTLSFITPEVLQAFISINDADVEIVGERIFFYTALLPTHRLNQFRQRCIAVFEKLNDNLNAYKDDRLEGIDRQKNITSFGRQLLVSPMRYAPVLLFSGLGTLGIVYATWYFNSLNIFFDQISAAIWLTFVLTLFKVVKIVRKNRKLEKAFMNQEFTV